MKETLRQIIKELTRCAKQNLNDATHNHASSAWAVAMEQRRMRRILKKLMRDK